MGCACGIEGGVVIPDGCSGDFGGYEMECAVLGGRNR